MATHWRDMEQQMHEYLARQSAFTDLGLNIYKGYDGNLLGFDEQSGMFPDGALPALTFDPDVAVETQGYLENGWEDVVTLSASLIYATDSSATTRESIETAQSAIVDTLLSPSAVRSRMKVAALSMDNIATYEVRQESVSPIRDQGGGSGRYWVWNFDVELTGNRRFVT